MNGEPAGTISIARLLPAAARALAVELDTAPEGCAFPDCSRSRTKEFLGWHGDKPISSAYCEAHGPQLVGNYCSACGHNKGSRRVWPDGVPPLGVVDGVVGPLSVG